MRKVRENNRSIISKMTKGERIKYISNKVVKQIELNSVSNINNRVDRISDINNRRININNRMNNRNNRNDRMDRINDRNDKMKSRNNRRKHRIIE